MSLTNSLYHNQQIHTFLPCSLPHTRLWRNHLTTQDYKAKTSYMFNRTLIEGLPNTCRPNNKRTFKLVVLEALTQIYKPRSKRYELEAVACWTTKWWKRSNFMEALPLISNQGNISYKVFVHSNFPLT